MTSKRPDRDILGCPVNNHRSWVVEPKNKEGEELKALFQQVRTQRLA